MPVRTDAVSRSISSQCAAISLSSGRPAINGASAGQRSTGSKAYSLRSAILGIPPHRLVEIANHTVKLAKAEVEAAHANLARQVAASIASSAEQRLVAMSRRVWRRALTIGSVLAIVILALGFGLGYWRGNTAGYDQAAITFQASGPVERAVLSAQGPAGLDQWHQLMRDNGILDTMQTDCTGNNIAHQDGRTACHLWLWTTPYVASAAHG